SSICPSLICRSPFCLHVPATTPISTLSLHDALPILSKMGISTVASYRGAQVFEAVGLDQGFVDQYFNGTATKIGGVGIDVVARRSEEHTSELQSRENLVCRLLLEKKKHHKPSSTV